MATRYRTKYTSSSGKVTYGPWRYRSTSSSKKSTSSRRRTSHSHSHGSSKPRKPTPTPTPTPTKKPRAPEGNNTPLPVGHPGMNDGGPAMAPGSILSGGTSQHRFGLNLENNSQYAQGSHHPWAQPSSISSLISGLLGKAQQAPIDYWNQWAQSKGGQTTLTQRQSSPYGFDASFTPNSGGGSDYQLRIGADGVVHFGDEGQQQQTSSLAQSNPMGAFGTNSVMEQYEQIAQGTFGGWYEYSNATNTLGMSMDAYRDKYGTVNLSVNDQDKADWMRIDPNGYKAAITAAKAAENKALSVFASNFPGSTSMRKDSGAGDAYNAAYKKAYATFWNKNLPSGMVKMKDDGNGFITSAPANTPGGNGNPGSVGTPKPPGTGLPTYIPGQGGTDPFTSTSGVYNPWSRGEGGENNSYGVSQNYLGQSTMEAMSLANAYFAPQRMELAYELGDMETDMRRLAAGLGRQGDDPVLQAKLFKEGMRAVRTLDVQQNTYAFQLSESRRKEEMQNFQFYDQLGQEEYRLKLANAQFYDNLELQRRYYNLQNFVVSNPAQSPTSQGGPASVQAQQEQTGNYVPQQSMVNNPFSSQGLYANSLYRTGGNLL